MESLADRLRGVKEQLRPQPGPRGKVGTVVKAKRRRRRQAATSRRANR